MRAFKGKQSAKKTQPLPKGPQVQNDLLETIESLVNSMADGLIVVNKTGVIQTVNQSMLNLLGYEKSEVVGFPMGILETPESGVFGTSLAHKSILERLIHEGSVKDFELTYRAKD